ncbi:MAG: EAL domain-containing protein [Rhodocyclaceae bacterium]|nr:EAL domain-containing protein [Rhodocyclaceae bacterium]
MTLRTRLLLSVLGVGVLLAALLVVASNIVTGASARSYAALTKEALPLAELHGLQSHLNRIRIIEIELPQMREFFSVTTQLETLEIERAAFGKALGAFLGNAPVAREVAVLLRGQWERYSANLDVVVIHGMQMDMEEVARVSAYESTARFKTISQALEDIATQTETAARVEFDRTAQAHRAQMQVFILVAAFGLIGFGLWLVWLWRALFGRLLSLRDAAIRVADGRVGEALPIREGDELAELAAAFNGMQARVQAREQALREAQDALEMRVRVRTRELKDSNQRLSAEVAERQRAEHQLLLLFKAVEQSPVGVMITDTDGVVEYINPMILQISGFSAGEVLGRRSRLFDPALMTERTVDALFAALRDGRDWEGELHMPHADGGRYWEHLHLSPVIDTGGAITHFVAVREDISERKAQEAEMLYRAHHDALTDLPNRALAVDRLNQALRHAERQGAVVALLFIDMDNFKTVNDTLGHEAGDALLVAAGQRIRAVLRGDDTVARHGGDEFLVILTDAGSAAQVGGVAQTILQAFGQPFDIDGAEVFVTLSIGATLYPDDGANVSALLRNADLAMYEAKDVGRNSCRFFNPALHETTRARMEIESCLRGALARGEFHLVFQPVMRADSGRIVGAEALLRWNSPTLGAVPPDRFIDIAERTGLIVAIGDWVLEEACRQAGHWQRSVAPGFRISVNVSPRQFRASAFAQRVAAVLARNGMSANSLIVEVTEGLLLQNHAEVRAVFDQLIALGVRMEMDDFGTGYSSLSYLKHFPFNAVKIDREFVRDVAVDPDDRVLVDTVIRMGKSLGLSVIAEGVETAEQLDILRALGCDLLQGYYFSRPVTAEVLSGVLAETATLPPAPIASADAPALVQRISS